MSGAPTQAQAPEPVAEMDVQQPTLRWVSLQHPQQPIPIGESDYVLDSFFNVQFNTWEVLVLIEPEGEGEESE
jgi:hypothetical protein